MGIDLHVVVVVVPTDFVVAPMGSEVAAGIAVVELVAVLILDQPATTMGSVELVPMDFVEVAHVAAPMGFELATVLVAPMDSEEVAAIDFAEAILLAAPTDSTVVFVLVDPRNSLEVSLLVAL